jgi:hypothetical protein
MTDQDLLDIMAELTGESATIIEQKVNIHKRSAISRIYAKTKPFWIKSSGQIDLTANQKVIDLKDVFPDIWQLRFLYTTAGRLDYLPEEQFRNFYGRNTAYSGLPGQFTTLSNYEVEIRPVSPSPATIYANYFFKPDMGTITSLPDEWQFVVLDYVMAMMLPKTYTMGAFLDGLNDVKNLARPSIEADVEFEQDYLQGAINVSVAGLSRSK